MSIRLRALAVAAALLIPGPGEAAPFTATLQIEMGSFATVVFGGSGAGTSNGSLVGLPASFVSGQQTLLLTPNAEPPLTQLFIEATNASGTFTGDPLQGVMPVKGGFVLKAFGGIGLFPFSGLLPLTQNATRGFGVGSAPMHAAFCCGVLVTLIGAPWTAATATIVASGVTHTRMGSDLRTPGGLGSLELVTPFVFQSNISGTFPFFGTLHVTFVPEPDTLLLCAAGVTALAARGAHRRRVGS